MLQGTPIGPTVQFVYTTAIVGPLNRLHGRETEQSCVVKAKTNKRRSIFSILLCMKQTGFVNKMREGIHELLYSIHTIILAK